MEYGKTASPTSRSEIARDTIRKLVTVRSLVEAKTAKTTSKLPAMTMAFMKPKMIIIEIFLALSNNSCLNQEGQTGNGMSWRISAETLTVVMLPK
ncbi:hypothetical protein CEXT_170061 [Caerostris extrusa]|uniref:Uncharacterized protein n=1 Tax=Caerostris extrusa TaxID=172846 RepID=A0AAV4XR79_CAEEX|nr:hypothetical protein CEXT_170061 [Caerostris extrusa]